MEAKIIAEAGKTGAVTIATNMAGRGTDIKLGGNKDFIEEGKTINAEEHKKNSNDQESTPMLCQHVWGKKKLKTKID